MKLDSTTQKNQIQLDSLLLSAGFTPMNYPHTPGAFSLSVRYSGSESEGFISFCHCGECEDCFDEWLNLWDSSPYACVICEDRGCEHCRYEYSKDREELHEDLTSYPELRLINGRYQEVA